MRPSDVLTPRRVAYGGIALLLLMAAYGSVFRVDQTELANVRRFGTVLYPAKEPLLPGLHFKLPFIDRVDARIVTLQTLHIPPFDVLTVDNQKVTIEENFNYTIAKDQFYHVMYEVGGSGNIEIESQIIPVAKDRTARVFAAQNMVTVNASREAIQAEIEKNVTLAAESLFGITPHSLQIAAITPSANFMKSIDEATMAKNSAIAAENQLRTKQFEAQQVAATAKGKADATIEEARGQAESTRLNANAQAAARIATATAEAQAIEMTGLATAKSLRVQSEAVKGSPDLVEWTKATKWNGALPTALYSGAPIPFMNVASPK